MSASSLSELALFFLPSSLRSTGQRAFAIFRLLISFIATQTGKALPPCRVQGSRGDSTVSSSFAYLTIILIKYFVCQRASRIGLVSASQAKTRNDYAVLPLDWNFLTKDIVAHADHLVVGPGPTLRWHLLEMKKPADHPLNSSSSVKHIEHLVDFPIIEKNCHKKSVFSASNRTGPIAVSAFSFLIICPLLLLPWRR